jgi:elongation factor 2
MRRWLPLSEALMYATVVHLPSPIEAQRYRVDVLFDGPRDHPAYAAIRDCDAAAPLMMYVSKMIPSGEGGRFYAFGRVFSGTVTPGMKVDVLGANFVPGSTGSDAVDFARSKPVQRVLALVAARTQDVDSMPCGNTVALVGLESYLLKTGTVTTFHDNPWPIRSMRLAVSPVVRIAVRAKNAADLPRLAEAVARLSKTDPLIVCTTQSGGGFVIAGAGELHLEICLTDLRDFLKGAEIVTSPPVVEFRETVLALSSQVALAKSPNKHNRIFATAEPLPEAVLAALESKTLQAKDKAAIAKALNAAGHDTEAKRVMAVGPEGDAANVLIDCTSSVAYLTEARETIVGGFLQLVTAGVLAKEEVRGVLFKLVDASFHADAVHRGASQVTPAAERAFSAAVLLATPRLVEPYYRCTTQVPEQWLGTLYSCLTHKRGRIVSEEHAEGTPLVTLHADLPVLESFGLHGYLQEKTSGQATGGGHQSRRAGESHASPQRHRSGDTASGAFLGSVVNTVYTEPSHDLRGASVTCALFIPQR